MIYLGDKLGSEMPPADALS